MAFVSVLKLNRNVSQPKVTVYSTGNCLLPKVVCSDGNSIDVEIDLVGQQLRLRVAEGLSKPFKDAGAFTIPKAAYREIVAPGEKKAVIALEKHADGWWYGSYRKQVKS